MCTLKEAIKKFPSSKQIIISNNLPNNFNELSYVDKVGLVGYDKSYAIISVKDDKLFFGIKTLTVNRCGKNVFTTSKWSDVITIEGNKVKSNCNPNNIRFFYSFIDFPLMNDLKNRSAVQLCKPFMIKAVLCGKIYSQETFYKEWMSKSYHLKGFDWRLFKRYINSRTGFSVLDLKLFTKDLRESMTVLSNLSEREMWMGSKYNLLKDLLNSAIKLGEVVDFTWSSRRMNEEHKRQTQMLMAKEINKKDATPIYDLTGINLNTDHVHVLNTEKDVFGEASLMHHCLYTNYFGKMKVHNHIAFHMNYPENCTFSCVKNRDGNLIMDQIYLAYDKQVRPETKEQALSYIAQFSDIISKLLDGKAAKKQNFAVDDMFDEDPLEIPGDLVF